MVMALKILRISTQAEVFISSQGVWGNIFNSKNYNFLEKKRRQESGQKTYEILFLRRHFHFQ
jgi:hypothetical protein